MALPAEVMTPSQSSKCWQQAARFECRVAIVSQVKRTPGPLPPSSSPLPPFPFEGGPAFSLFQPAIVSPSSGHKGKQVFNCIGRVFNRIFNPLERNPNTSIVLGGCLIEFWIPYNETQTIEKIRINISRPCICLLLPHRGFLTVMVECSWGVFECPSIIIV